MLFLHLAEADGERCELVYVVNGLKEVAFFATEVGFSCWKLVWLFSVIEGQILHNH